jgi:hypothetical protein
MHINLSSDRLLHLLALIVASAFFGFIVEYYFESGFLFSCSGGVTIAVQISNAIDKFRNPVAENNEGENDQDAIAIEGESSGGNKRTNKKQLKAAQRKRD